MSKTTDTAKVHLILAGRSVCNSRIRSGGRLGTASPAEFRRAGDECCERCKTWLNQMTALRATIRR
jgi:hypothetical protein